MIKFQTALIAIAKRKEVMVFLLEENNNNTAICCRLRPCPTDLPVVRFFCSLMATVIHFSFLFHEYIEAEIRQILSICQE